MGVCFEASITSKMSSIDKSPFFWGHHVNLKNCIVWLKVSNGCVIKRLSNVGNV